VKEITGFGRQAKLFLTRSHEHEKVHIAKLVNSYMSNSSKPVLDGRSHAPKKRALGRGLKEYGFVRVSLP
jgi:hypothetical protein